MGSKIRVLVTADQELMREGMRSCLRAYDDVEVIGDVADGGQSLEETRKLKPDVVLIDISTKVMNGLEATRRISRDAPQTKVLVLLDRYTKDAVTGAFLAGACGCIPKTTGGTDLASAIRAVYANRWYLHPSLTGALLDAYMLSRRVGAPVDPYDQLTDRERHVLRLLAEGRTGREIAQEMGIAVKTVMGHSTNVKKKLGINNRAQLIKYAMRRGIIDPEA